MNEIYKTSIYISLPFAIKIKMMFVFIKLCIMCILWWARKYLSSLVVYCPVSVTNVFSNNVPVQNLAAELSSSISQIRFPTTFKSANQMMHIWILLWRITHFHNISLKFALKCCVSAFSIQTWYIYSWGKLIGAWNAMKPNSILKQKKYVFHESTK